MIPHNWKEFGSKKDTEINVWHCSRCNTYAFQNPWNENKFVREIESSFSFTPEEYITVNEKYEINSDCDLCLIAKVDDA
jgi:NMD protein affecting ribosome stability and mRNA decay